MPCLYNHGTVLAHSPDSLSFAVDLTPYCISRSCPTCGRDELFYLTKCKRSRSDYFSFTTGHELRVKDNVVPQAPQPLAEMRRQPLGSRRSAAAADCEPHGRISPHAIAALPHGPRTPHWRESQRPSDGWSVS